MQKNIVIMQLWSKLRQWRIRIPHISNFCIMFFFISIVTIGYNCNKSTNAKYENIVKNWNGRQIILPELKTNYGNIVSNDRFKLVTRINGDCYPCLVQLKNWSAFVNDVSKEHKVSFYIYVYISDTIIYNDLNRKELHLNYPVLFDQNDQFRKLNNLHKNEIFHTMLLDHSNNVILIGNPINNIKLRELYVQTIKTYKHD